MKVRDAMRSDVITVGSDTPLTEAIALMLHHRISGLPVIDSARHIIGVLTEKDLLRAYGAEPKPTIVADLMTRDPVTLAVDAPLVDAFDLLMARPFRRVLVEEGGLLVGLVSRADLMPAILEGLEDASR